MPFDKKPGAEPIRGYRLIEPLGSGGFGEVWKCEAPGGIVKAIKFVNGESPGGLLASNAPARAEEEFRAVQRIKSIRHPFLLSIERVEVVGAEVLIVTELADLNLHQLALKYRSQGLPGVPRMELLGYLREAAEVLDLLNLRFDLQHLDIKPRNLFLVSQHVKVADFGLVQSLVKEVGDPLQLGAITPIYTAPEIFAGKLSRQADQYSLAIVFQELLTGVLPFAGKNGRQLLIQHTQEPPDLSALPVADRPAIARALSKDPEARFPSCMDSVRGLGADTGRSKSRPEISLPPIPISMADTDKGPVTQHLSKTPSPVRAPRLPEGVLPGYIFVESLGSTPLGDTWKVQDPVGEDKVVKFFYGLSGTDMDKLRETVTRLRSIRHPALISDDIVLVEPGRMVGLTECIRETIRDRWVQCQKRKLAGIPRGELLDYLRSAAEALDYLSMQHGVQHLSLSPRQLILDNGWLQITEFGLAQILWLPAGQDITQRNARYAAPELYRKQVFRSSDQFSLAVIYTEMLTGVHPFHGQSMNRAGAIPQLQHLPEAEQAVIARALNPDPAQRWPSATDMVMALEGTPAEQTKELKDKQDHFEALLKTAREAPPRAVQGPAAPADLHRIVRDIMAQAGGLFEPRGDYGEAPVVSPSGDELTHSFQVGLPLGSARQKLETVHQRWYGQLLQEDDRGFTYRFLLPNSQWQKWLGRSAGLDVQVKLARVQPMSPTPIQVAVHIRAFGAGNKRSIVFFQETAPQLLDTLRQALLINSEKRTQERILWPHPVMVIPLHSDGRPDEPLACRGKDISPGGMGLYLPEEIGTANVLIELPNPDGKGTISIPATLVRARRCADDWYDVGALFRMPALRASHPELCTANTK